jgi:iron complex outermembrane recepter protein
VKKSILVFVFLLSTIIFYGQELKIVSGIVKDAKNNETIIGATVTYQKGKGITTDIYGNYSLKLPNGEYNFIVSYVGYQTFEKKVIVDEKNITINFLLEIRTLDEVEIIADYAKTRETPIAFSNISIKQIREELGTRDLVTILNSTPGVYVSEVGGGSGDARVSIRGFDQRNIAVLVDGMPVNDMENGQVYWSNWDGLGDAVRSVQVQRGLGSSKLAIASVGGTMNTITKGIESNPEITIRKDVSSNLIFKTSFVFNTGLLKGGWGLTGAFSKKKGDGFAEQTWTDAYSYFLKIQKRMGNHLISLSGSGAPQSHGQRSANLPIGVYDTTLARSLGIDPRASYPNSVFNELGTNNGIRYNPNAGNLFGKRLNDRVNYFHKPQLNISHFWNVNEKLNISTVLYASFGNGGGTALDNVNSLRDTIENKYIFDQLYTTNSNFVDGFYSVTETKSTNFIKSRVNQHKWYGILSTINYKINNNFSSFIGLDLRSYKGIHYNKVYNLLGGDYVVDSYSDANLPQPTSLTDPNIQLAMRRIGDKIERNYEGFVKWAGGFGQIEYKKDKFSAFFTTSVSQTQYQRKDYYAPRELALTDTIIKNPFQDGDTFLYDGLIYNKNSPEFRTSITEIIKLTGYTFKTGANYNLNRHHNVYVNLGLLKMPPRFDIVFTNTNIAIPEPKMQDVIAFELGYGVTHKKFAANVNTYYTNWKNKPISEFATIRNADGDFVYDAALDALHIGVELDFIYKLSKKIEIEGIVSIGDWVNKSSGSFFLNPLDAPSIIEDTVVFSAQNVHVGDAAQIQFGNSLRYNFFKEGYLKLRSTFFQKHYSRIELYSLRQEPDYDNRDRESWKTPNYFLLDLYAGYAFVYPNYTLRLSAGINNLLDAIYISDAENKNFDAASALVFIGAGRRMTASIGVTF